MVDPSKRDWKLYREKIGKWQEHYMEKRLFGWMILKSSAMI